nr:hypothetical protein [uncultured Desulfobacter sp.]
MQQSSVSNRENSSHNTRGMVWSTNTRVIAKTGCGRHFTGDRHVRINKINRPMEKRIQEKRLHVVLPLPVMIWIIGLLLAGSEGSLMPYLNIAGAVVFFGASVWLGKILPGLEPDADACEASKKKDQRPAQVDLSFCGQDHCSAQGTHHLGLFGDKNLFFKGI